MIIGDFKARLSRRGVLRGTLAVAGGLGAAALVGCGGTKGAPSASPGAADTGGGQAATKEQAAQRPFSYTVAASSAQPKRGGSVVVAVTADIGSMDVSKSGATGNLTPAGTTYETLLRRKVTTKESELGGTPGSPAKDIEGGLAQSWEVTPDGLTYSFKLRTNAKWINLPPLNGRAFTATDVVYSYQRYATTGIWKSNFDVVAKMEAVDPTTVKITLKRPSPDFIVPLAEQNNPIQPKELVDNNTLDKVAIGTGPMILKENVAGQAIRYVRNPDYWGPAPYLDGFEFRIIPDTAAQVAAFRAGQIIRATARTPKDINAIKDSVPGSKVTQSLYTKSVFFTSFNMTKDKWKDERVRQAFSLALDRDAVNDTLYDGLSNTLPVMPWNHVLDKEPVAKNLGKWWRFDLAESKKLLQAAGQENLKFDWIYTNQYLTAQNEIILDQFRKAGFQVNAQQIDYVQFNAQLAKAQYDDAIQAWDPHGTQADNYFNAQLKSGAASNLFYINDPQIDTWADQQSVELDPQKRREILRKIWDRMLDKMYRVEHTNSVNFTIWQPWIHGMEWIVGNDGLGPSAFGYNTSQFVPSIWTDK